MLVRFLLIAIALASFVAHQSEACPPLVIPVAAAIGGIFTLGRHVGSKTDGAREERELDGCFADGPNARDMGTVRDSDDSMTKAMCIDICRHDPPTKYAGIQNRTDCYCSDKRGKFGEVSSTRCNMECMDRNPCGGFYVNSVYKTGI